MEEVAQRAGIKRVEVNMGESVEKRGLMLTV